MLSAQGASLRAPAAECTPRARATPRNRTVPLVPEASSIPFFLIAGLWLAVSVRDALALRRLGALPGVDAPPDADPPGVSVIIAARDEEAGVEHTARTFLDQRGVDLQLVIVDDRSADATPDILARLAARDGRLEPVRVETLPPGWLGKCHALNRGAAAARGAWLLFADADTELLAPDALRRAIDFARRQRADHVCLFPRLSPRTIPARALACSFLLGVADRLERANRDRPGQYFGVGAFNLVRAQTYRSFGGHEPLRLEVLDDVHLGALVRRAGGRSRAAIAIDAVGTSWGGAIPELIAVLEKNMFAAVGYRVWMIALVVAVFLVVWAPAVAGPVFAIALGSWAPMVAFAAVLVSGLLATRSARRLGFPRAVGLLTPFVLPIFIYAGVRSAALTLRRGGVRWRETFYPLDELRAGRFR